MVDISCRMRNTRRMFLGMQYFLAILLLVRLDSLSTTDPRESCRKSLPLVHTILHMTYCGHAPLYCSLRYTKHLTVILLKAIIQAKNLVRLLVTRPVCRDGSEMSTPGSPYWTTNKFWWLISFFSVKIVAQLFRPCAN